MRALLEKVVVVVVVKKCPVFYRTDSTWTALLSILKMLSI